MVSNQLFFLEKFDKIIRHLKNDRKNRIYLKDNVAYDGSETYANARAGSAVSPTILR